MPDDKRDQDQDHIDITNPDYPSRPYRKHKSDGWEDLTDGGYRKQIPAADID